MQKYIKPKYSYSSLGTNPFSGTALQIPVNELALKNQYTMDSNGILTTSIIEVEATPFTKLYVTSNRRLIISGLTPSAKSLYLWIFFEIEAGKDALWINKQRYMLETNTSLNTFKKAIDELVRYALITYSVVKEVYWINPDFFFRGDRIAKYPKNVVK